jgi:hypothetical protein
MAQPFGFIPSSSFANLPSEPGKKFLILSDIAEANFDEAAQKAQTAIQLDEVRHRFMIQIEEMAKALGLSGTLSVTVTSPSNGEWNKFLGTLEGLKTTLYLRPDFRNDEQEIEISGASRRKILLEISRLRSIIAGSDLPHGERDRILAKLDALASNVQNRRMSFREFMTLAATIAGLCGGTSSALANAPEAKETIVSILGYLDDEFEQGDESPLMLPPPSKALPPPDAAIRKSRESGNSDENDSAE